MKIMQYDGPKQLKVTEAPELSMRDDQLRIKTLCSGISHGTEMSVYRGVAPFFGRKMNEYGLFEEAGEHEKWEYPLKTNAPGAWYMGYANIGEVVEVGSQIKNVKVGDIVWSQSTHQSIIVTDEKEVRKIPDGIKPEHCVLMTNLITAYNGIMDAHITLGDTVVISGLGVLGQLCAQMAKLSGAHQVYGIDMIEKRLEIAKENGCDEVFNPKTTKDIALEIRKRTNGKGADVVIDVSGNGKSLNESIRIAANDTNVIALGWYQYNLNDVNLAGEFHHNRIGIKQSHTSNVDPVLKPRWDIDRRRNTCLEILKSLKMDNLITQEFAFEDAAKAYALVDEHPEEVLQVVLKY